MSEYIQVLTSVDSREAAQGIAKLLVEKRLAACVQVLGPIRSTYWWQGMIEEAREWLVLAKSRRELYPQLEETIRASHPYSVPEILALPILAGHSAYLEWLRRETHEDGNGNGDGDSTPNS
jgi:periplasmic divalent cation tolerance protein